MNRVILAFVTLGIRRPEDSGALRKAMSFSIKLCSETQVSSHLGMSGGKSPRLQRFYRITMPLKRPYVPKSDVKQLFTITTAQLSEPKDDLFTVSTSKYIMSTVHRSHLITLITKAIDTTSISYEPLWLCCWRRYISSFLFTKN